MRVRPEFSTVHKKTARGYNVRTVVQYLILYGLVKNRTVLCTADKFEIRIFKKENRYHKGSPPFPAYKYL